MQKEAINIAALRALAGTASASPASEAGRRLLMRFTDPHSVGSRLSARLLSGENQLYSLNKLLASKADPGDIESALRTLGETATRRGKRWKFGLGAGAGLGTGYAGAKLVGEPAGRLAERKSIGESMAQNYPSVPVGDRLSDALKQLFAPSQYGQEFNYALNKSASFEKQALMAGIGRLLGRGAGAGARIAGRGGAALTNLGARGARAGSGAISNLIRGFRAGAAAPGSRAALGDIVGPNGARILQPGARGTGLAAAPSVPKVGPGATPNVTGPAAGEAATNAAKPLSATPKATGPSLASGAAPGATAASATATGVLGDAVERMQAGLRPALSAIGGRVGGMQPGIARRLLAGPGELGGDAAALGGRVAGRAAGAGAIGAGLVGSNLYGQYQAGEEAKRRASQLGFMQRLAFLMNPNIVNSM